MLYSALAEASRVVSSLNTKVTWSCSVAFSLSFVDVGKRRRLIATGAVTVADVVPELVPSVAVIVTGLPCATPRN